MDVGFKCIGGKGFIIKFDNGVCISVQWGPNDNCSNRLEKPPQAVIVNDTAIIGDYFCQSASVAVWQDGDPRENITTKIVKQVFDNNNEMDSMPYLDTQGVADMIYAASKWKSKK